MVSLKEWHGRPARESTRKMRVLRLLKEIDMPVGALSLAYETTDQELKAISDEFETAPPRKSRHCRKLKNPTLFFVPLKHTLGHGLLEPFVRIHFCRRHGELLTKMSGHGLRRSLPGFIGRAASDSA